MTFDPNYVPKIVDFVIAYNMESSLADDFNLLWPEEEVGIATIARSIHEQLIMMPMHENDETFTTFSQDTVIYLHGNMLQPELWGMNHGIRIAEERDARLIISYDRYKFDEELNQFLPKKYHNFPFSPKEQISFFDPMEIGKNLVDRIAQYLRELAELRA